LSIAHIEGGLHQERTQESRSNPAMHNGVRPPAPRQRLAPPLRVECVGDASRGPRYLGYASDLSSTGLFLQTPALRAPGTRLKVKIHARRRRGRPIYAEVEVRWSRTYGGLPGPCAGMGVAFVELTGRERKLLLQFLCANESLDSDE
jgi:hypothetical protein